MQAILLGHEYHYEVYDDSAGTPVVFLHGFSQSARTWDAVRDELLADERAEGLRLVLLDLIGHGGSERPAEEAPYALAHAVAALEAFRARELGGARIHLVGYSMGGRVALAYAVAHPDALASLVLESASFGPRDAEAREAAQQRDRELAERLQSSTAEEFASWWAGTPVLAAERELPECVREAQAAMRAANDTGALARSVLGSGQGAMHDLFGAAAQIPVPLLYVCGEKDAKYAALAREAEREWGLDVRCLPTGHNVHLEQPVEYAEELLRFFGRVRADRSQ